MKSFLIYTIIDQCITRACNSIQTFFNHAGLIVGKTYKSLTFDFSDRCFPYGWDLTFHESDEPNDAIINALSFITYHNGLISSFDEDDDYQIDYKYSVSHIFFKRSEYALVFVKTLEKVNTNKITDIKLLGNVVEFHDHGEDGNGEYSFKHKDSFLSKIE